MHDDTGLEAEVRELSDVVEALLADQGGCEWNRSQTHESLITYLVEECAELVEAIEDGTADDRREELGDVLYQVVLHAAIAARASDGAFDLADSMQVRLQRLYPGARWFGQTNSVSVPLPVRHGEGLVDAELILWVEQLMTSIYGADVPRPAVDGVAPTA